MDWEKLLPFLVVGGIVIAAMSAMRPAQPTVINPNPPTPPQEDDSARLQAAIQLAELAVQRDIARMQAEAELRGRQYELEAKRQETELERRRIEAEKEVAQSQAQADFWGSFWSGLFGLGAAILVGLSDEALYQKAIPSYYPKAGQLAYLARRDYGNSGRTR